MGFSMNTTGNYSGGFMIYGITSVVALGVLLLFQHKWTSSWVGKGGKAHAHQHDEGKEEA